MARVFLVEAQPVDPATRAGVPVRIAGGGTVHYTHKGFVDWKGGLVAPPKVTAALGYDDTGFTGGAVPTVSAIGVRPAQAAVANGLAGWMWVGAPLTVSTGDDAVTPPAWTVRIAGTVAGYQLTGGQFVFTVSDLSGALAKPLVPGTFAGTGGAEGGSDATGRVKRRSWGRCWNVEGRLLVKASNVYEFGDPAQPLQSIDLVKDKGRSGPLALVAWQGSVAATLATLMSAVPPPGGAAVAPSIACAKWWTVPSGPLTADLRGEVGAGYVETVAAIADRVSQAAGGPAVAQLAAVDATRPDAAGVHVDDGGETAAAVLDRLLLRASLAWSIGASGALNLLPIAFANPVETVAASLIERDAAFAPVTGFSVGYKRNQRVQSAAEISAAVLAATDVAYPDGTAVAALQPAQAGATVGAQTGVNLVDSGGTTLADSAVKNVGITISAGGALAGGGGGQVTFGGLGGGAVGTLATINLGAGAGGYVTGQLPVGNAAAGLVNVNVSIGANGALAGGGGGQVTFGGLGGGNVGTLASINLGAGAAGYIGGLLPTGNAAAGLVNVNVSIGANGALAGGGGGQVTIGGLGYAGDLDAQNNRGAQYAVRAGAAAPAVDEFDAGPGSWSANNNCSLSVTGGFMIVSATGGDPSIRRVLGGAGSAFPKVRALIKAGRAGCAWDGTIFWDTQARSGFTASYLNTIIAPFGWASGDWCVAEWDMTKPTAGGSDWTGNIPINIRMDLNADQTDCLVQWIAFGDFNSSVGTAKLNDSRSLNVSNLYGLRSLSVPPGVTASSNGSSATITVDASGAFFNDFGITISLPSASMPGLPLSTTIYLCRYMPVDGAGTGYGALTSLADAVGTGKAYLGYYSTPNAAGAGGGGGSYGGSNCVAADAWVPTRNRGAVRARDVRAGDELVALSADLKGLATARVTANRVGRNLTCAVAAGGARLALAVNTPMTQPDGRWIIAANVWAHRVATLAGLDAAAPVWLARPEVAGLGEGEVAEIACGNATFAAGDDPEGPFMFSHNYFNKP